MSRPDVIPWIPGTLLSLGALLTLGVSGQRTMPLALPLDSIPAVLAGRVGTPVTLSPAETRVAGMTSYILRSYDGEEAPFTVYVGYYDHQTQGRTIHSPKNCLPGSGWEALQQAEVAVATPLGPQRVNRYMLQNKQTRALVFYWYQGRGRVAANEYRVKWELLRDAALRGRSEEALVRIVVMLNDRTGEAEATRWAERVASELIPSVFRVLPA